MAKLRMAAFGGFRTIPIKKGGAGSDKFAQELYPRIAAKGIQLTAYCRIYPGDEDSAKFTEYKGIKIISLKTVNKAGFDTLLHSAKATLDVIFRNRADVIHLHSGANSIFALFLRMFGKKVYISQFAMDWKRDKWPWYGKLFYKFSNYLTASVPNGVIFDNIYTRDYFEKKFHKKFDFIPYGSEVAEPLPSNPILQKLGLTKREYFLFVGRFIPDKGLHILIEAFSGVRTDKKLVLIGGSPNPSDYEKQIMDTKDPRIIFPGYVYGEETNFLMKNAYVYIQPSLIEGLSPVILTVMGLGTALICSDIVENLYITEGNALHFKSGDAVALKEKIEYSLDNPHKINELAEIGRKNVLEKFNWDKIADKYLEIFSK